MDDRYLHDWSGTIYGSPRALERPRSTSQVSSWIQQRHRSGTPIAVQGGRTGVSGGASPGDGEHVLSLEGMNEVLSFDRHAGVVVVQAGVVLSELQDLVEKEGWCFPLDLGSRGSCQLGGNAATNAGGSRVIKYGNVRNMVLGLEAVLADGSVIGPPNQLVKNNAGYSLTQLLIGSEGTLGVITQLALKLVPRVAVRHTALVALCDTTPLEVALERFSKNLSGQLSAFEVMWPAFVAAAFEANPEGRGWPASLSDRRVVLIETEADETEASLSRLEDAVAQMLEDGLVVDALVAQSSQDAKDIWAVRESIGEIQSAMRPYVGFDLGIAVNEHDQFVARASAALSELSHRPRHLFFGHAGDGNLHALVGPCKTEGEREAVESAVYGLMPPYRSTVTAEHGVGRKRKHLLQLARSSADLATMRAIKQAMDPKNILNPGRIFDL